MSEQLSGDNLQPEAFEDMRQDIMDLERTGIISSDEAAERLASLEDANPTVAAAHKRNIVDNL